MKTENIEIVEENNKLDNYFFSGKFFNKERITLSIIAAFIFLFILNISFKESRNDFLRSAFLNGSEVICNSGSELIRLDSKTSFITSENEVITNDSHTVYPFENCSYILSER